MLSAMFDGSLNAGQVTLLLVSLGIALGFEFVNGFHDTANAVATVIYTRALTPRSAVILSGICNFLGVCLGGTAVAFAVVNLLPVDLLISIGSRAGMAMVFAILLSAIAWNLGTWYLGLPASSSHTLIGGIIGVGLAHSLGSGHSFGSGVNWGKVGEVFLSLLISPVLGFALSAGLLLFFKATLADPALYEPASPDQPPPRWIRRTLVLTCSGVSLAHGSNDGQKGVGLIMLILVGLVPAHYALNPALGRVEIERIVDSVDHLRAMVDARESDDSPTTDLASGQSLSATLKQIRDTLAGRSGVHALPTATRWTLRTNILLVAKALKRLRRDNHLPLAEADPETFRTSLDTLNHAAEYAPTWVLIAVALSLGLGTTIGWKRIVETVGEKIGKTHLSYAQGASAEIVAMGTIALADFGGLPVSTTHVLSSGVAGTMAANGSGLQLRTIRNIALAWVLTLPIAMAMSGGLFLLFRWIVG
jgi:PiT family inorganic phosphate transporter